MVALFFAFHVIDYYLNLLGFILRKKNLCGINFNVIIAIMGLMWTLLKLGASFL
jgi:hypothetical protein